MHNLRSLLLCICLCVGVAAAAPALLSPAGMHTTVHSRWPADTPIRLCALRVEFVEDHISGTTGTGRMGSGFDSSLTIDPLPHDKAYFEDHLRFLQHYFETVSAGRVAFETLTVFPPAVDSVYRLDYPMWHYNYNSDDALLDRRLVELFVHATAKAAHDVDFTQYDAIVVFHAGTGKDFNLGYDATPFDIPSAYISERDVAAYAGDVAVPPGVTRGLILPEGENQQEALDFGVELSLNGIAVKLFGNWLGMPDLFDTRTGRSGIGRWGMMDQGSGNVNALVPAMPDAWSRTYMHWDTPATVIPSGFGDTLRVARVGTSGAPQILKFPVTPDEYFLVENRDADADSVGFVELRDRAGRRMRIDHVGTITVEDGFRVAVSASHYDFGIPGSGLLIWHIDEKTIARGLADNTVNSDASRRGVDLVEADAAQDIGQLFGFASAGAGTELGIQEDAWYRDNRAHRAANGDAIAVRFNDRTFPASRFYDGSTTRLDFSNYSVVAPVMSFVARTVGMVSGFPLAVPLDPEWVAAQTASNTDYRLFLLARDTLFVADTSGHLTTIAPVDSGLHLATRFPPVDLDADGFPEILLEGRGIGRVRWDVNAFDVQTLPLQAEHVRVLPARTTDGAGRLLSAPASDRVGSQPFVVRMYDLQLDLVDTLSVFSQATLFGQVANIESLPASRFVAMTSGEAVCIRVDNAGLQVEWRIADARLGSEVAVVAESGRRLLFLSGYGYVDAADGALICAFPDCIAPRPDWDGDGIPEGGGAQGRSDLAWEGIPPAIGEGSLVLDIDASGVPGLWRFYGEGPHGDSLDYFTRLNAITHDGRSFAGFPLAAAANDPARLVRWHGSNNLHFVSVVTDSFRSYIAIQATVPAHNGERFAYTEPLHIINVSALRPQVHNRGDWLYCWPNPTADVSRIRLTFSDPARAEIKIFDLAGRLVTTLSGASSLPGPFEIPWDVSRVESGIYIGQVRAEGSGFVRESQIKIAVVK